MDYTAEIAGKTLEYFDDEHLYLVDGIIVPSITQVVKGIAIVGRYHNVAPDVLKKAADKGTAVHEAIENYVKNGVDSELPEVRGFKFLQRQYNFQTLESEVPVILFSGAEPVAAGRLDLVIQIDGFLGGADIKRTAVLDKNYLFYQLNLYRLAYLQSYGIGWKFLRGIHLREEKRKFVEIPLADDAEVATWIQLFKKNESVSYAEK